MMFLLAGKRRCAGRRNPLLGSALGFLSALIIGVAAFLEQRDGAHWPLSAAAVICIGLVGLAVIRLVALNRDDGSR